MSIRIAVLGGSAVVTPQLVEALGEQHSLSEVSVELVLVGRSHRKLAQVAGAARRVASANVAVVAETDLEAGVTGASYVLNQVRVGGLEGRAFDERFPQTLGLPGEETMGPGGFASAWRTLPALATLFRRCVELAPEARLLNLTNPAGMVHQVAARTGLAVTTFCDSPITLAARAARAAALDPDTTRANYIGTNHGGWLTSLRDSAGDDVLSAQLRDRAFVESLGFDAGYVERIGALPNAYLRYLYHPDRQLAEQAEKSRVRAEELLDLEQETLASYQQGSDLADVRGKRRAVWYSLCIAPALAAFITGEELTTIAGISNGALVPWLPPETMLELPVRLDGAGASAAATIDPLQPDVASLLSANAAYESLAVDALLQGGREDRIRAMAANPMVSSVDLAARAVEAIEARERQLARA